MDIPKPKYGFKLTRNVTDQMIEFECNVPDIIADIQTACDAGMGVLRASAGGGPNAYYLLVSALYDKDEVLSWLHSFDE